MRQAALGGGRIARLDDDRAVESRIEHRLVVVRVIDERAGLIGDEAVDEAPAVRDERLRDAADAVHLDRNVVHAVQMNRVGRRAVVRVIDDDRIALSRTSAGPGTTPL